MRPTGNCRPALEDLDTAFLADFPFPRPDMVAGLLCECLGEVIRLPFCLCLSFSFPFCFPFSSVIS